MLARTRRQQLMLAHRQGRAVPAGIPDGLRNMWNDTDALDKFPDVPPPGPGAAPLADVPPPPPDVPPARPVVDLMLFEPPAAQPPADAQPKPEAPAPHVPDLLNLFQLVPDELPAAPAADAARPAADAALPAEVPLDELEALRARCAELEARIPEQEALKRRCEDLEARVEALQRTTSTGCRVAARARQYGLSCGLGWRLAPPFSGGGLPHPSVTGIFESTSRIESALCATCTSLSGSRQKLSSHHRRHRQREVGRVG